MGVTQYIARYYDVDNTPPHPTKPTNIGLTTPPRPTTMMNFGVLLILDATLSSNEQINGICSSTLQAKPIGQQCASPPQRRPRKRNVYLQDAALKVKHCHGFEKAVLGKLHWAEQGWPGAGSQVRMESCERIRWTG